MQPKIFLFANNGFFGEEHIIDLNIDIYNDIIVLLNYMYIPYAPVQFVKHKIAFLRTVYIPHEINTHYLGGVEFIQRQKDFKKVICVDDTCKFQEYTKNINIPCELLIVEELLEQTHLDTLYPDSKIPTTGFVAYLYMSHLYPNNDIILVGFTGHYADGTIPDNEHHEYSWEQQYYTQQNVTRVYTSLSELQCPFIPTNTDVPSTQDDYVINYEDQNEINPQHTITRRKSC